MKNWRVLRPGLIVPGSQEKGHPLMSIDRSLKLKANLARHRNVLSRSERVDRLMSLEHWNDQSTALGLPKVGNRKPKAGKKKAAVPGAEGAAAAAPGAAAPAAAAPDAAKAAKPADAGKAKAAPAKK